MPGTPPRAVGLAAGRRPLIRLAASLVAVAAALGGMAVPAAAADPFDLRIHPDSTSRYIGEYGDASLDFCTTEPAYTTIEVHDASGALVERIRDDEFNAYACDFTYYLEEWDRLDDEGSRVPAGLYTVTFRARSESGATDVETVQIGVYWEEPARYTYLPVIPIDQPFEVEIQLEPWFFELATVTDITLWCNDFRETALVIGSVDGVGPDGRASVPGDPAPCAPGDSALYCAMTWLDPFAFEHTWSCSQTTTFVAPIPTGLEIGLVYRYSWPEEHFFHLEGPADVSFCLSAPAIVDAVVVDGAGTVVRTLASGESFPASPCDSNPPDTVLTWDYRDEAGGLVPDGEYQVEMTATAQSGSEPPEVASRTLRWHVWNLSPGEWVRPVPGSVLSGSQTAEFHRTPGFDAQFPMTAYAGCSPIPGPSPRGDEPILSSWHAKLCPEGDTYVQAVVLFTDPLGGYHVDQTSIPVTIFHPVVQPTVGVGAEGDTGTTTVLVPVALSAAAPFDLEVSWEATSGTATAGSDFVAATGTVLFEAGQTTATVPVTIVGDDLVEGDEMVFVRFLEPDDARVGGLWGHGFAVIDDDDAGPTVRAGSAEVTETDGATIAEVPLVLSAPSSEIVEVEWDAVANTAQPGSDFASASGTAVFAPGETQTTVSIEILGDDVPEPKELVVVALRSATNAQIGGWLGLGFAHITDDD